MRCHLLLRKIEDFFTKQFKYEKDIFAQSLMSLTCLTNLWDKILPSCRPFMLHNLNQDLVKFAQIRITLNTDIFFFRKIDNQVRDVLSNPLSFSLWKNIPSLLKVNSFLLGQPHPISSKP